MIKAQEKLASNYKGVFQEWVTSSGMSLDDAYYFINLNKSSRNLDNTQRDNFLKAPKTVQKKTMQKNTPEEVKEAVYSGEVKTNKELEELKKRLKNQSETIDETTLQLKSREKENEILQSKLEEMESRDVEVKTVYKDRVPKHLEQQMKDKEQALIESKRSISELQAQLNKMKQKHQETYRREELTEDEQLGSRRFQAESNMLELVENMNEFLEVNAVNSFKQGAIAHSSERTKKLITEKVEEFEVFCRAMRTALNNQITIN